MHARADLLEVARQLQRDLPGIPATLLEVDRQLHAVEEVVGLTGEEFDRLNKALTRLERFWTDQILYLL